MRDREQLARSAVRGTAWVAASRLAGRLLFFASTVVLARLLEREDFGVAAYAIAVIAMFSAIPGLGLAPALIHHRDDPEMLDTGFWLGLLAGATGFALVWVAAPLAGWAFADPRAVDVTRALGLLFPIESLRNVHATLLARRLDFRRRFVPELVHATGKGLIAIVLALAGFGYWSLILGTVGAAALAVPVYWWVLDWHPRFHFDRAAARRLLPFGGHVVAIDLLGALIRNADSVLVGRLLGAATLGVYTLAFRIPDLLIRNLATMLGQVLLPVYARLQSDRDAVHATFVSSASYVFALTAPMAAGLALLAEPVVVGFFSEKWIDVATVIPPICLYALLASLSFNVGDLYKALGRPDVLTRLSLLRASLVLPALWYGAAVVGTPAAVGWAQAGVAGVALVANLLVAQRVFELPLRRGLAGLAPPAIATGSMALALIVLLPAMREQPAWGQIALGATVGAAVYVVTLGLVAREFCASAVRVLAGALRRRSATAEATP